MSTRRRLVRHVGSLAAAEAVVRVLIFATAVVATRVLGPREIGAVAVAMALVSYAGVLGDGGMTTLTQVRLIRTRADTDRLIVTTTALQLVASLVLSAVLVALAFALPLPHEAALLTAFGAPLLVAQALNTYYALQAEERMAELARIRVTSQVVTTAVCLVALAWGAGGASVVVSQWVGLLAADAYCLHSLRRGRGLVWQRPTRPLATEIVRESMPYLAALIATQLITNADVLMLGLFRTSAEVGRYSAALRLSTAGLTVIAVVITAVFPELVRRMGSDTGPALIDTLVRLACRPAFAVTALVCTASSGIVTTLYGASFRSAGPYLAVLFLMVPIGYFNSILAQSLVAAGQRGLYLRVVAATATATVVALLALTPAYGASAAAAIVVAGEVLSLTLLTFVVRGPLGLTPLPVFLQQTPFLIVPVALGLAVRYFTPAGVWGGAGAVIVAAAVCEVLSPVRLLSLIRGITSGADSSRES